MLLHGLVDLLTRLWSKSSLHNFYFLHVYTYIQEGIPQMNDKSFADSIDIQNIAILHNLQISLKIKGYMLEKNKHNASVYLQNISK